MKYKLINKAAYFPKREILTIADIHLGFEEEIIRSGILIPKRQLIEIERDLEEIFKKVDYKVKKIIILGDLKHSFGSGTKKEKKEIISFLDFLKKKIKSTEIILVKGNHDNIIERFIDEKIKEYYLEEKTLFIHGDKDSLEKIKEVKEKYELIVMGHFHPAIDLTDGEKKERFKCFIEGEIKNKKILILPSFFNLIEGMNILQKGEISLLKIKKRKISIIDDEGKVWDISKLK
ncbi:MAG: metallophosphoesterase [Candidatus Pacearchaeota archaeon]